MTLILICLLAYLLGSISSAVLVSRVMGLPDPRNSGSGNPGATNVLRSGSKLGAALTLLGDMLKGTLPVVLALSITRNPLWAAVAGLAAFIGHIYPLFFRFQGGKGVATAFGVFLGLSPSISGVLLAIWLGVALAFRYSSLAALVSAALSPLVVYWLRPQFPYTLMALVIAVILFYRHKENIARLRRGEESRIKLGRNTKAN